MFKNLRKYRIERLALALLLVFAFGVFANAFHLDHGPVKSLGHHSCPVKAKGATSKCVTPNSTHQDSLGSYISNSPQLAVFLKAEPTPAINKALKPATANRRVPSPVPIS